MSQNITVILPEECQCQVRTMKCFQLRIMSLERSINHKHVNGKLKYMS